MRETWTDDRGRTFPVPAPGRLKPTTSVARAALRRFVFVRDGFSCRHCGDFVRSVPIDFSGKGSLWVGMSGNGARPLHVDHIVPRIRGGTNHPDNLQALCESCNARKRDREEVAG